MKKSVANLNTAFIQDIRKIISTAQSNAVRSVEFHRVEMYWKMGERIFVEEQQEKERAEYGSYLVQNLSLKLEKEYGSGFSKRQLERARQFYRLFPIASALRTQLNWMQYKLFISIADDTKREFYELEAVKNRWNGRELERQINAQLFERLLLSSDIESVMAVAREQRLPEAPQEIVKDPMYLEFLGLNKQASYYEHDLESEFEHAEDGVKMKSNLWIQREFIAELIKRNVPQGEGLLVLNKMAIEQMTSILGCSTVKELGVGND